SLGPVIFTKDHMLILAVVPVVIALLAWFLGRTDAGIAMRASAENLDRARLLGIPVAKLSTLVWFVAGGLSALTYVLTVPTKGAVPSGLAGPELLLPALAAAVLARMESLPVAFFSAAGLGALEQLVYWSGNRPSEVDVVFLVVILIGLLVQHDRMGRLSDTQSSWTDTAVARPVPTELRRLPEVRGVKAGLYTLLAVAAVAAPFVYGPSTTTTLSLTLVWAMVGISLVVLTGWGGHISLGQFAIVGVGAVTAANRVTKLHADLFVALLVSAVVGGVVALLVGPPRLRDRGLLPGVASPALPVGPDGFFLTPTYFHRYIPESLVRPHL